MKQRAQVVVIGGGVVGASVLYHLTKGGWSDVVLVERRELTHGSTWHAAGGMHTLNGDPNVAALQKYTVELYHEIEQISGQSCGIHLTGGLVLADSPERLDFLKMATARAGYLGMDAHMISAQEAHDMVPFLEPSYFLGAMYDAHEGHVDPTGVTHAYAQSARIAGAEVYRHTWAHNITPGTSEGPDGWTIHLHDTRSGDDIGAIECEHFVNAGGLWAREVGRMTGLELPVLAMEHMYLLTDAVPELVEWRKSSALPGFHVMDLGGEIYMREEGDGLLLGTYEPNGVPWSPTTTPWDFGAQLLTPDLDRLAANLDVGFSHFPIFNEVGIKQTINGPFTFTPDGNPLIGPVAGQPGHWLACGVMAGLSQGGGVGLATANWMIGGDPGFDVWGMDNARFGEWATPRYTNAKVRENYGRRFRITFPNEELPAARGHMKSPIHDRLVEHNAVWGASYGLEAALWFQRPGREPEETVTFRRSNAFDMVAQEVNAVRSGVGMIETTGYATYEFAGAGARDYLDRLFPNHVPPPGRMALTPMLNERGHLIGDFTVATLPDHHWGVGGTKGPGERFLVVGSGVAQRYHQRWFLSQLQGSDHGDVQFRMLGNDLTGLSIAGPASKALIGELCDLDGDGGVGFLDVRETWVGSVPVTMARVSFTGDFGYELWCPSAYQQQLFDTLMDAGGRHGVRLFGLRALDSMRLEKLWGAWATEFRPVYTPFEANLGWMVRDDKDYVGKAALDVLRREQPHRRLVGFEVHVDDDDGAPADCIGDEPISFDGKVVGWVTSGGYGHHVGASLALGYVPTALAQTPDGWEIDIVGEGRRATLLTESPFDPTGSRLRA